MADEQVAQPLEGLAAEVDLAGVDDLLIGRSVDYLDPEDPQEAARLKRIVRGIATEVTVVAGVDPKDTARDLALWAITVGTAAQIEASLAPEQVGADGSAARLLKAQYLAALDRLGSLPGTPSGTTSRPPSPSGRFPGALPYPDPACGAVRPPRYPYVGPYPGW